MRLTQSEIEAIRCTYLDVFQNGSVYLFGSRVDDNQKGGDIDLYVVPENKLSSSQLLEKKIDFLVQLKNRIGEQKIDVVIARDQNRLIEQEALRKGIKL
ncbi:MAG: nucleotidyltransferase domain-containing protein [Arcobacteraceae bacterium]